jgi:hypothetical protein
VKTSELQKIGIKKIQEKEKNIRIIPIEQSEANSEYTFLSFSSRDAAQAVVKYFNNDYFSKYADRSTVPECAVFIRFNPQLIPESVKNNEIDSVSVNIREIFSSDGIEPNKVEVFRVDKGDYKGNAIVEYKANSVGIEVLLC